MGGTLRGQRRSQGDVGDPQEDLGDLERGEQGLGDIRGPLRGLWGSPRARTGWGQGAGRSGGPQDMLGGGKQ